MTIAKLEPKVIAIDLLLVDRGTDDGDDALAKSLAGRPSRDCGGGGVPGSQSVARRGE